MWVGRQSACKAYRAMSISSIRSLVSRGHRRPNGLQDDVSKALSASLPISGRAHQRPRTCPVNRGSGDDPGVLAAGTTLSFPFTRARDRQCLGLVADAPAGCPARTTLPRSGVARVDLARFRPAVSKPRSFGGEAAARQLPNPCSARSGRRCSTASRATCFLDEPFSEPRLKHQLIIIHRPAFCRAGALLSPSCTNLI